MTGSIFLFGEVGKHITVDSVRKQMDPKATEYEVHLSSPGGDVFEGYTIYNLFLKANKPITFIIEGLCASIATLMASSGRIKMSRTAQFMIHNPSVSLSGDSHQLRSAAGQLDKIKTQLIDVYQRKTGLDEKRLWDMSDRETWLTADEALSLGFIDEIMEPTKAVAYADITTFKSMENQNEIKGMFQKLERMFKNFMKVKNLTDTLEDGTVIVIESEDGDWIGKPVTYEDGTVLPDGNYTLASGTVISVAAGVVSEVTEVEVAPEDTQKEEEMKALDAANARIKELESALEAQTKTAQTANAEAASAIAKAKTFENNMKAMNSELTTIKNKVFGDESPVQQREKQVQTEVQGNPLFDDMLSHLKNRNLVK